MPSSIFLKLFWKTSLCKIFRIFGKIFISWWSYKSYKSQQGLNSHTCWGGEWQLGNIIVGLGNFDLILKSWNVLCQFLEISLCFFLSFMQGSWHLCWVSDLPFSTPSYELVCLWGLGGSIEPAKCDIKTHWVGPGMLEISFSRTSILKIFWRTGSSRASASTLHCFCESIARTPCLKSCIYPRAIWM